MAEDFRAGVTAYIGLGGNLADPVSQLLSARKAVAALPQTRETAFSSLYRSTPMGPADQPDYVNAVMAICTTLDAHTLLHALQAIEREQGRVRTGLRWGPRTLDLDLLIYGGERITNDELTVPHAGIAEREFVLYPLAEIAPPGLNVPGHGPLASLVASCPRRGLEVLEHA